MLTDRIIDSSNLLHGYFKEFPGKIVKKCRIVKSRFFSSENMRLTSSQFPLENNLREIAAVVDDEERIVVR